MLVCQNEQGEALGAIANGGQIAVVLFIGSDQSVK